MPYPPEKILPANLGEIVMGIIALPIYIIGMVGMYTSMFFGKKE